MTKPIHRAENTSVSTLLPPLIATQNASHKGKPLAVHTPALVVSVSPVVLPAPGRAVDLQLRVSAPTTGRDLPVILLSHGHGQSNNLSSLNGYGPLANYYAAQGFVVIQPTHLDSMTLHLDPNGPEGALF